MKHITIILVLLLLFVSCSNNKESTLPTSESITESVYASGYIKSKNQYAVFPKVNGIVEHIYVSSGDQVIKGALHSFQSTTKHKKLITKRPN